MLTPPPSAQQMDEWPTRLKLLTRREMYEVLPQHEFSRLAQRTKEALVREAAQLTGEKKTALLEAVENKEALRNHKHAIERGTLTHIMDGIESYYTDPTQFLSLPTAEDVRQCQREFYQATSNAAIAESVCASCAQRLFSVEGEERQLTSIPNIHLLRPRHIHPAHHTFDNMLLVTEVIQVAPCTQEAFAWFCSGCLAALAWNKLPPLALANQMWIGPIPPQLARLTLPEQLLIAHHYPRCFVFKLFPKAGGSNHPDTLQRGMSGNVTTYALNLPDIVSMLEGNLMPRPPQVLASVIAVAFIGMGQVPKSWLKSTFRVRRHVVLEALTWLKAHNPLYQNVTISLDSLQALPVDNVPDEILASFRQEEDPGLVERECETYVPGGDNEETDNTTGVYKNHMRI